MEANSGNKDETGGTTVLTKFFAGLCRPDMPLDGNYSTLPTPDKNDGSNAQKTIVSVGAIANFIL